MKTITIELTDNGGFRLKGLEDIESHSECIQLMLAVRMLETTALEKGYLPELREGLSERIDKSKNKIRYLTEKEYENLGIDNPVSPTYIQIELPNNVPSKVKPIVILPSVEAESVDVKVAQNGKGFVLFDATLQLNQSHVINMNTEV